MSLITEETVETEEALPEEPKKTRTRKASGEPKAPKAPKAPKEPKVAAIRAGANTFELTSTITMLVEGNPKRGASAERFVLYRNGMTVQEALDAGLKRADIVWDSGRGFIKVGE